MAQLPKTLTPKHLLTLLKTEKNLRSAVTLFDTASTHPNYAHSPAVFNHILRRLSRSADPKFIPNITRIVELIRLQQCPCSEDTALAVLKIYSRNLMVERAMEIFQKMKEVFGCDPGVRSYNCLMNAFVVSNQLNKAEVFFRHFRTMGVTPNLETYNILIKIACKKMDFDKARALVDDIWATDLVPDVYSYGALINGLTKSGDLDGAVKVFDEMIERGLRPDVACYNILIDGFFKKGDYKAANGIWDRLSKDSWVYPNVVTYNISISGLCKCGRFSEGLQLWDRMSMNERTMDLFTYSSLIHGLCQAGDIDGQRGFIRR
ncbi:UNVERIFIED_CONTAM: Pentatricopeptide repeat-containing protein [Sesamum latifolium]|uniref:Pentatricopeptide repeat-containing protein n=1 Tax=Sesamum latifolium TaxID=2727402 RepID=A0AAW2XE36_9LAMI